MIASLGQFVKNHAQVVIWVAVGIVMLGAVIAREYRCCPLSEFWLVHCLVFDWLQYVVVEGQRKVWEVLSRV